MFHTSNPNIVGRVNYIPSLIPQLSRLRQPPKAVSSHLERTPCWPIPPVSLADHQSPLSLVSRELKSFAYNLSCLHVLRLNISQACTCLPTSLLLFIPSSPAFVPDSDTIWFTNQSKRLTFYFPINPAFWPDQYMRAYASYLCRIHIVQHNSPH